jgi:predicted transcriptional regulator
MIDKFCEGNKRKFSTKTNVSVTTLNGILKRGTDPSYEILRKIVETYEEVNSRWLITGKGTMFNRKTNIPE